MLIKIIAIIALAWLICLSNSVYAADLPNMPVTGEVNPKLQKFDQQFSHFLRQWRIPGSAVAIVKDGQLIYARGFGYANLESKQPIEPNSLFRIASVSKAITAVTILKLIEDHQLNLDDKAFKILNDIKPIHDRKINPRIYQITVLDLLEMSSGWIPSGQGRFDPMYGPWSAKIKSIVGEDNLPPNCKTVVSMMITFPMHYKPGTQFSYSNLDYCALGLIINKKVFAPYHQGGYEAFVKTQILDPLKLDDMCIGSSRLRAKLRREVTYYPYLGAYSPHEASTYLPYSHYNVLGNNFSNGGWIASAIDLAKFSYAVSHYQIISRKMVQFMLSKPKYVKAKVNKYFGLGWRIKMEDGKKYWYATGSFTGTNALVLNRPDGSAIAVIFNSRPPMYELFYRFRPQLFKMLTKITV